MLQLKWLMQEFNSEIEFTSHELEGPLFIFPPISLYFLFPLNTEPIVRIWALTVYFLADHRKQDCQTGKQKHWYRGKANTLCVLEVLAIEIGAQLYWKLRCTQNASWILWRIRDCALYLLTLLHCKVGLWVWTYPPLWATSALGPGSRLPKKQKRYCTYSGTRSRSCPQAWDQSPAETRGGHQGIHKASMTEPGITFGKHICNTWVVCFKSHSSRTRDIA
jgi:hypothetical protein